ncbi:retrovirus-related pol polyprotein from transposon TNT 1-94 [Tanacetum coccineum]
MAAFWGGKQPVPEVHQFKVYIDNDSQMINTTLLNTTGTRVNTFRDTLLQHLGKMLRSPYAERTRHQRTHKDRAQQWQEDTSRSGNEYRCCDADIETPFMRRPMAELFRCDALHTEVFDQEFKAFSCEGFSEDIRQLKVGLTGFAAISFNRISSFASITGLAFLQASSDSQLLVSTGLAASQFQPDSQLSGLTGFAAISFNRISSFASITRLAVLQASPNSQSKGFTGLAIFLYAIQADCDVTRQQATINDERVTLQPVQERQISFTTGTTRTYTPRASGSNSEKQRTVICYNCKGEGHMSKQCTKPKRKWDDSWFKDKVLLVQAQANGQILHEEELAFLADPGTAEVALMANLSHYGLDALAEVYNPDNMDNNMINQGMQVMPYSEQSNVVNHSETEITSDSNIIPYSQESLMQTVTLLKNDFKKEESRNIDREIALEKKIKHLDNIKAKQLEPKLYDGNVVKNTSAIVIPDFKETLMLAEESHSKTLLKQQYPMVLENKVNTTSVDYAALNQLSQDFEKRFVPQTELSAKQAYWS